MLSTLRRSENPFLHPTMSQTLSDPAERLTTLFMETLEAKNLSVTFMKMDPSSTFQDALEKMENIKFMSEEQSVFSSKIQQILSTAGIREFDLADVYQVSIRAIKANKISLMELILKSFPDILTYQDPHLTTYDGEDDLPILHVACSSGNKEMVKLLINNGADVNLVATTKLKYTGLDGRAILEEKSLSAYNCAKNEKIRQILLENGATVKRGKYTISTL